MIRGIDLDHVAVAAERQRDLWPRYAGDLSGSWLAGDEDWGDVELDIGFRAAQVAFSNGMKVEMLEPYKPERNDFLRRFLDRNGPGPHHLTFKVKDIRAALDTAESAGYQPVGVNVDHPGWKEAFLHPKQARGVVVQLAQSGNGDWTSQAPVDLPAARTAEPARLDHVAHAVASLDDALELFGSLLDGQAVASGQDEMVRWVELAWPGPGRVRLLEPLAPGSPMAVWLGDRPGRVHHVAFTCDDPGSVEGAVPLADGRFEVPPEANFGTRLVLGPS